MRNKQRSKRPTQGADDSSIGSAFKGASRHLQKLNPTALTEPVLRQATWMARGAQRSEVDDIVQQSLLVLLGVDCEARFDSDRAAASAYARGIARRVALAMHRKSGRFKQLPDSFDKSASCLQPLDVAKNLECRSILVETIALLPPRFRGAVYEKYGDFGTGEKANFPVNRRYYAMDLHRAHARLRVALKQRGLDLQCLL